MKKVLLFSVFIIFTLNSFSQTFSYASSLKLSKATRPSNIAVDNAGNTIVIGGYGNGVDNTGPSQGAYIAKYSPTGQQLWVDTVQGWVGFMSVTVDDENNIYVAAKYLRTIIFEGQVLENNTYGSMGLLAKYDINGNNIWFKHSEGIWGSDFKIAYSNQAVYCFMGMYDTTSFQSNCVIPGQVGFNLIKFDKYGNYLAQNVINIPSKVATPFSIEFDPKGDFYLLGEFSSLAIFDTISLNQTSTYHAYFVAKYHTSLQCEWAKEIGATTSFYAEELTVDEYGNTYVAGIGVGVTVDGTDHISPNRDVYPNNNNDAIVVKLKPDGSFGWVKFLGDKNWEKAYGITSDKNGGIFVTGFFNQNTTFDNIALSSGFSNTFVVKLDTTGAILWAIQPTAGNNGSSEGEGIISDHSGNIYVAGPYKGTVQFGNTTHTYIGFGPDMYVTKLSDPTFTKVTEIKKEKSGSINVYPNPSSGSFNVALNKISLPTNIKVHNLLGELILQKQVTGEVLTIELTTKGTYFIELSSGEATEVKKLVVQ